MFDIDGARKAGYSDEEIADYLGQQKNFDTVAARNSGYSDEELISHLSASQDITPPEEQSTAWGTAARGAMESLIPSAAGIAAFMPGFEVGAAVGSAAGPVGTVAGGLIGGLGTSMGAGALVHEGQKYLLDKMPEVADYLGLDQEQRALDEKLHPYANLAGSLAPQALAFRPSVSNLKSLGAIPEAASAAERSAIIGNRINVGAGAAIGGGQEAAMEYLDNGEVDPYKVAIATAAGATMNTPTAIGEKLNAVGARLTPDFVSRNNPYSPNYKNKTMTELVEEEKAKIYNPINAATRDRIDENQVDLGKVPYEDAPDAIITPAGDVEAQIEVKASPLQRAEETSSKVDLMNKSNNTIGKSADSTQKKELAVPAVDFTPTNKYRLYDHDNQKWADFGINANIVEKDIGDMKLYHNLDEDSREIQFKDGNFIKTYPDGNFEASQGIANVKTDEGGFFVNKEDIANYVQKKFTESTSKKLDTKPSDIIDVDVDNTPLTEQEKAQYQDYKDAVAKDERKAQGLKHNEQIMYIGGTTKINKTDFNLVQKRNKLMEWNIKNPENQKPIPEKAAMAHKKYESFADDLKDVDFVPGGNIETFEPMFSKTVDEKNLIVQHNLTEENLAHAEKMGGIPVPSLAITKKDIPLDGFGEITLLGNKELADPKGYAKTQVYGADIYSPRYPSVDKETNKIFDGYTPSGKRKYLDHNLDNVVKIMKKNMRGGEGWNYGTGNLRAMVTPQFKTIKDIKANSDKLTTGEHFEKVKEEIEDELFTLRDKLAPYYKYQSSTKNFGFTDTVTAVLAESPKGIDRALKEYDFIDVPAEVQKEIFNYMQKLKNMPTEYFEAKITRAVKPKEFHTAVVPDTASAETIKYLKDQGINIKQYKRGDQADRARAIKEAAEENDLLFSKGEKIGGFKSVLEEAVSKMPNKMDTASFIKYLKNNGVKDDEINFSGIKDILDQASVTKADVEASFASPRLEKTILKAETPSKSIEEYMAEIRQAEKEKDWDTAERLTQEMESQEFGGGKNETKYQKYSTPDVGTNYREVLTTLKKQSVESEKLANERMSAIQKDMRKLQDENELLAEKSSAYAEEKVNEAKEKWKAKNLQVEPEMEKVVLTNIRMEAFKESPYASKIKQNSKDIQEIVNEIRRLNKTEVDYKSSHWDEPNVLYHTRLQDATIDGDKTLLADEIQSDWHQEGRSKGYKNEDPTLLKQVKEIFNKYGMEFNGRITDREYEKISNAGLLEEEDFILDRFESQAGIPAAPYSKTWHEKAMKDIIDEAIEKGYDRVAWATGKTNADRYGLANQIDGLDVSRTKNGEYHLNTLQKDSTDIEAVLARNVSEDKLQDYVGKEMAQKIINDTKDMVGNKKYTGLDLEVGGEGMKGFYDKILPEFTNKYIKKFDSKVEIKTLSNGDKVWSFEVTPKMKEQISEKGQPLFAKNEKVAGQKSESVKDVERAVKKLLGKNADKVSDNIVIVEKTSDLPKFIRDTIQEFDSKGVAKADETAMGVYAKDKKVYIVADNIKKNLNNSRSAESVILHELLHKATVGEVVPEAVVSRLSELYKQGDPLVIKAVERTRKAQTSDKNFNHEVIAYLLETYHDGLVKGGKLKEIIENIIRAVKRGMIRAGLMLGKTEVSAIQKMNARDIAGFLKQAAIFEGKKLTPRIDMPASSETLTSKKVGSRLQEWHKDSAPETKNEDGTPKVFYHQTSKSNAESIYNTKFNINKVVARGSDNLVPDGFFFKTNNKDIGVGRSDETIEQMAVHLNIKNPYVVKDRESMQWAMSVESPKYKALLNDAKNIDNEFTKIVNELENRLDKAYKKEWNDTNGNPNIGQNSEYQKAQKQLEGTFEKWEKEIFKNSSESRKELTKTLKSLGYDGVNLRNDEGSFGRSVNTWIAFEPTQIKSIHNKGTFDETNPNILFSKADQEQKIISRTQQAKDWLMDAKETRGINLILKVMTQDQKAEVFGDIAPELIKYQEVVGEKTALSNKLAKVSGEVVNQVRKWAKANPEDADKTFNLMHETTLEGIDPTMSREEQAQRIDAYNKYIEKHELKLEPIVVDMDKYEDIKLRYDALPAESKQVYEQTKKHYQFLADTMYKAIETKIKKSDIPEEAKTSIMNRLRLEYESRRLAGPYFPLSRFGDYIVQGRNLEGKKVFEMFESPTERDRRAVEMEAAGYTKVKKSARTESKMNLGADTKFMNDVFGKLEKLDPAVARALEDDMYQLYLQNLPNLSARKQFLHRQGVLGYSDDALRVLADKSYHMSRQIGTVKYSGQLEAEISSLEKRVRKTGNPKLKTIYDDMLSTHEHVINPAFDPLAQKLTSFGYSWYLSSASNFFLNLTQLAQVVYPKLSGKYGIAKTTWHMAKASKDISELVVSSFRKDILQNNKEYLSNGKRTDVVGKSIGKFKGDELRAIKYFEESGAVDVTMAHDLAGIGAGDEVKLGALNTVAKIASIPQHYSEIFNRLTTLLASYRLERAHGSSHEVAVKTAERLNNQTNFNMMNENRAAVMRSPFMKVVTQFKSYSQNMAYFMLKNSIDAVRGNKEAAVTMGVLLLSSAFISGVKGLPLQPLEAINLLLNTVGLGYEDFEDDLYKDIKEVFGENADLVWRGALNKLTGADVGGRAGLGDLFVKPPQGEQTTAQAIDFYLQQALGPTWSTFVNMIKGGGEIYKAIEKESMAHAQKAFENLTPKPIRDISKTERYGREGAIDSKYNTVKEEFSARELATQAIGFSPEDLAKKQESNNRQFREKQRADNEKKEIMNTIKEAQFRNDNKLMNRAIEQVKEYNIKYPALAITGDTIVKSIEESARSRSFANMNDGSTIKPKYKLTTEAYK